MKVLVIAQSEVKAADAEAVLQGLSETIVVKKVFMGAKRIPRHFEAVVIYHTSNSEVNFIKDEIQRYGDAPIRAFLSKAGAEAYPDAATFKVARSFKGEHTAELWGYLKAQREEIDAVMKKAFDSFDKDASGYIDKNELREVSKEIGHEFDQAELDECLKDLDVDKDGRISF